MLRFHLLFLKCFSPLSVCVQLIKIILDAPDIGPSHPLVLDSILSLQIGPKLILSTKYRNVNRDIFLCQIEIIENGKALLYGI